MTGSYCATCGRWVGHWDGDCTGQRRPPRRTLIGCEEGRAQGSSRPSSEPVGSFASRAPDGS